MSIEDEMTKIDVRKEMSTGRTGCGIGERLFCASWKLNGC